MDFSLTDEQKIFQESVTRFVASEYDFRNRRKILKTEAGHLPEHWAKFAELGWLAAPLPEEHGGLGGSPVETMIVMEQFGRGLVSSPYLGTVVLCGTLIGAGGSDAQKAALLPAVADGSLRLAFAFVEPQARYDLHDVTTTARKDRDGYSIDGHKGVVLHAATAEKIIVPARTAGGQRDEDGITLFLVDADAVGLRARHYATQDGGRASELSFDGVRVGADAAIGAPDGALPIIEEAIDHGIAAVCAEASGIMWAIYEQTLEYHKTREQFGQSLGKFQALQHRMVDVYMKCELSQSMAGAAAVGVTESDAAERKRAASAAKFEIAKYGRDVGQEGVQLHGGIGMTDELVIGHYFKRLTTINSTFGDGAHHLARYRALSA